MTPEEQKVLDRQKQERKEASSYSYYTSSEDEPGEPVRLVPKADVKADPIRTHRLLSRHLMMVKERKRNVRKILMERDQNSLSYSNRV